MSRSRAPLIVAVVVLVGLAAVLVLRGRADRVTSPFELAVEGRPMLMAQTAETDYEVDVPVGDVCAPGGGDVMVRAVRLVGVDGALELTGFRPTTISVACESDAPQEFIVEVRRVRGESAHADGVEVTYEVDGQVRRTTVPSAVTVCRQLSEC